MSYYAIVIIIGLYFYRLEWRNNNKHVNSSSLFLGFRRDDKDIADLKAIERIIYFSGPFNPSHPAGIQ